MIRRALIAALLAGSVGFWAGHQGRALSDRPPDLLLVFTSDFEPGHLLATSDVTFSSRWPDGTSGVPFSALRLVAGHSLARPVHTGELVQLDDLTDAVAPLKKSRLATLDVPIRSPWLKCGDHVDVLTVTRDPQTNEEVTVTLLQNVIINGVLQADAQTWRLSLLVIPEEAEVLLQARKLGPVDVTLRNPEDPEMIEERGRATVNTVLSGERARVLHEKRRKALAGGS